MSSDPRRLDLVSWNVAAINNNPFEYWISIDDQPEYTKLMDDVQNFIENPGPKDLPLSQILDDAKFNELVLFVRVVFLLLTTWTLTLTTLLTLLGTLTLPTLPNPSPQTLTTTRSSARPPVTT